MDGALFRPECVALLDDGQCCVGERTSAFLVVFDSQGRLVQRRQLSLQDRPAAPVHLAKSWDGALHASVIQAAWTL
jgi:hypothetical protein